MLLDALFQCREGSPRPSLKNVMFGHPCGDIIEVLV
jgi:hypothetical protein